MNKLSPVLLLCLLFATACATTTKKTEVVAEIAADPAGATVSYRGKTIGTAPVVIPVRSIKDVLDIDARLEGQQMVEKRVHVVSEDRVEVTFKFGDESSPVAKALGLARVVIFDYSDRTTFDLDQATLKPVFEPMLEQQAEMLNSSFADLDVYVCGFTDSTGLSDHNLDLSLRRAEAVADFLAQHGVEKSRLMTQGFGEQYPLASNDTREGRMQNRRTEIVLPQ
jgi:outer membrane protein OmpA-like peptidoglycan-associated protein